MTRKGIKRCRMFGSVAVVVGMLVAGCGSSAGSSSSGSSGGPSSHSGNIRIGVEIGQTGDDAGLGVPALAGIRFTINKINRSGGIDVGNRKRKIKLIVRDDASNPDTARAVTQQLITDDKVDALIGGVGSNVVAPALLVAERYGVPDITTFAYSPAVLPKNPKFTFVNVPSTVDEFRAPLAFMHTRGVKRVGLVATNDDLGQGFLQGMPGLASKYGIKIAGIVRMDTDTTDFGPVISRLKGIDAPAVIVEAGAPLSYQFRVAQVRYHACKFKISHYEYGPSLQPDWVNAAKQAGIGAIAESFWWETVKGHHDRWFGNNHGFVKEYKQRTGKDPSWSTVQGVQSAELMALAIEHAGTTDPKAIAAAFMSLHGSTLLGPIKFDTDHFNRGFVNKELVIQQQGPKLEDAKVVFPKAQANSKFHPDTCGR